MNLQEKLELIRELEVVLSYKKRSRASVSLIIFLDTYLRHIATAKRPAFHLEMIKLLERMAGGESMPGGEAKSKNLTPPNFSTKNPKEVLTNSKKRLLFIAPRGFAKSTICSVAFPLWLALYGKRRDIFLVSATISLAKEQLRKIRHEIEENEGILADFGEMKSDKWTEDELVLSNGVIVRAKGRGFQIRGFRPDIIICDDLEDEEVIYSKEQRDKTKTWFFRTLLPSLKPDQTLVYVGTKLHQFSLIADLQKKSEFEAHEWKAITEGKSIWEEYWTTNRLNELRREMGEYAFQAEYQNNPISLQDQPVKPHMLDGVKAMGKIEVSCLAVDPAISEKTSSDERAFVLIGRTSENEFKEIYSESGRWGIKEQIERIIGIYKQFKPDRIVVESVAFQKVFKEDLLKEARMRGIWLPVSEAELGMGANKRPKDKFTRLMQVVHLFEQKLVEIRNSNLYQELIAFPQGDSDNLVDACVFSLYWLMMYRTGGIKKKVITEKIQEGKRAFYVEEVRPGVLVAKETGQPQIKSRFRFLSLK